MRVVAVTQARSGSTRLPGKILKQVEGKPLLQIHLERLKGSKLIDKILVATTTEPNDINVCNLVQTLGFDFYRGSENDVLDRFYRAVRNAPPDYVVRVTSDCPLLDPAVVDDVIALALKEKTDYCANILKETFPDGQDIEIFTFAALERSWREAKLQSDREHVTPFIRINSNYNGGKLFKAINLEAPSNYGHVRMTVDEAKDFEMISSLIHELGTGRSWKEYADYIIAHPEIAEKNAHIIRNEGYLRSLEKNNNNEQPL
jgi:spore coat polysaccharide biosynthesis protein SpsF